MPTKIQYRSWDGGEGGDYELIGYCKEEPFEVLKKVILTHNVYHYLGLYRPIDYNFPNNVEGLVIDEVEEMAPKGLKVEITGSIDDLDLSCALTRNKRSQKTILDSLEECKKWYDLYRDPVIRKIKKYVMENIQ